MVERSFCQLLNHSLFYLFLGSTNQRTIAFSGLALQSYELFRHVEKIVGNNWDWWVACVSSWVQIVCRGIACQCPSNTGKGLYKISPYKQSLGAWYFLHSPPTFCPQPMPAPSTVGAKTHSVAFQIYAPFTLACRDDPWGVPIACSLSNMDVPRAVPTSNHQDLQRGIMARIA